MESVRYASRVQFTQLSGATIVTFRLLDGGYSVSDTEWGVEIEGDDTRLCTLLIHAGTAQNGLQATDWSFFRRR